MKYAIGDRVKASHGKSDPDPPALGTIKNAWKQHGFNCYTVRYDEPYYYEPFDTMWDEGDYFESQLTPV